MLEQGLLRAGARPGGWEGKWAVGLAAAVVVDAARQSAAEPIGTSVVESIGTLRVLYHGNDRVIVMHAVMRMQSALVCLDNNGKCW